MKDHEKVCEEVELSGGWRQLSERPFEESYNSLLCVRVCVCVCVCVCQAESGSCIIDWLSLENEIENDRCNLESDDRHAQVSQREYAQLLIIGACVCVCVYIVMSGFYVNECKVCTACLILCVCVLILSQIDVHRLHVPLTNQCKYYMHCTQYMYVTCEVT